jgi:N-acetylglutamate synthase-like GNAT family acetyltransferase
MNQQPTEHQQGLPASKLSDAELERQGARAHAMRNWVFLHGTADQFRHHTERMLELEQEYLRRHPKRTWQGASGAESAPAISRAQQLHQVLRTFQTQMEALINELAEAEQATATSGRSEVDRDAAAVKLLSRFAEAPGGRLHKLEAHQAARELGLHPADVARLYKQDPPLLAAAGPDRVLTDEGRKRLVARRWVPETPARWDRGKAEVFGDLDPALFGIDASIDAPLGDEWWRAEDGTGVVGYGRLDGSWGDAEILIVVRPECHGRGIGAFVLDRLEQEAAARHLNYVYNVVPARHPERARVAAWLRRRGFTENADGELRKRVSRVAVQSSSRPSRGR